MIGRPKVAPYKLSYIFLDDPKGRPMKISQAAFFMAFYSVVETAMGSYRSGV